MKNKVNFAVMAVEASANLAGVSASEMYKRLEAEGLIRNLVFGCYDVMHTLSLQNVAEDLVEGLHNWEAKAEKEI